MPRCQFWAPVIRSLPQMDAVAVTFDDGPHPEYTPRILDILAQQNVKACFFVIGRYARKSPEIVRRIHAEGHEVGNHTLDHDHFGINRDREYWMKQVGETQRIVAEITGRPPMFFRPPMGFKNWNVAAAAKNERLPIIGWSVRAYDTRAMAGGGAELARRVLKRVWGHDILLLHDGVDPERAARGGAGATQQQTVESLPAILEGIREKKLQAVSLVETLVAGASVYEEAARRVQERGAT